ncbi:enoyl-CoA hydratase [Microbacteriaceae bacterium SG_E_30_P1]|uniref:Enoyl-CoA hydratase n=1 Tax=Antiquaquibacter oligotrophicus TaxID=2880260 RepID=A0ABT6KNB9_9MICO|nr:enoyl-CoA hydratase-related protein [Antiquaquibacter oligotrophicus]MDH6181500.1 enoyl-CoA hydratase [Antiquaquibacter oligotrophicus]UDF12810.1 enoyl-CoA hydratase/isomerase family protein [Antiquaquibacter oligotrophicus]
MTETIRIETRGSVGLITLDRPEALNALNDAVMREVVAAAETFEADASVGAIVITGSDKAFAAGADIKAMAALTYTDVSADDPLADWDRLLAIRIPVIAAVSGYALGGGCELAMMCDTVFASETAKFGQPEILLGIIPGIGGTQRLTRAVGKAVAMDLVLTGRTIDADEALRIGLVARVLPADSLLEETIAVAEQIAQRSRLANAAAKRAVNAAFELPLVDGLAAERAEFLDLFATEDRAEGMAAFIEKRPANFRHR